MEVAAPKKTHMAYKVNMANIICYVLCNMHILTILFQNIAHDGLMIWQFFWSGVDGSMFQRKDQIINKL